MLSLSPGISGGVVVVFFGVSNSNGSLCDAPPFVPVLFACLSGMTCASWYSVAPVLLAETAPAQIRVTRVCSVHWFSIYFRRVHDWRDTQIDPTRRRFER